MIQDGDSGGFLECKLNMGYICINIYILIRKQKRFTSNFFTGLNYYTKID